MRSNGQHSVESFLQPELHLKASVRVITALKLAKQASCVATVRFLMCLACCSHASMAVELLTDAPPYSVVAVLMPTPTGDHMRIAAFNNSGQVMLLGRTGQEEGGSWLKLGEKMVSGTVAKVVQNKEGQVSFDFLSSTAGAAIVIIGQAERVLRFEELPLGVHKSPGDRGYLLFARAPALSGLPLTMEALIQWSSTDAVEQMIARGQLQISKPTP
jgi:hypothetical protein